MARVKESGRGSGERRGWGRRLVALMAVLILVALGFALGVGLGILSVGPDLIVDHGRGRTQEVPWSVDAPTSIEGLTQPDEIAQGLTGGAQPAQTTAEPVKPRATPSATSSRQFSVQVGAFSDPGKAEALVKELRGEGLSVYRIPSADRGDDRWRVRVGPVSSRAEADAQALSLQKEFGLPTWVLTEGDGRDHALSGDR